MAALVGVGVAGADVAGVVVRAWVVHVGADQCGRGVGAPMAGAGALGAGVGRIIGCQVPIIGVQLHIIMDPDLIAPCVVGRIAAGAPATSAFGLSYKLSLRRPAKLAGSNPELYRGSGFLDRRRAVRLATTLPRCHWALGLSCPALLKNKNPRQYGGGCKIESSESFGL